MGRARQFLACILALILAAGLLQAPAVSMMSVFAAEAVETENAETDGNEDTAETSPIGEEEREDVIEGMSESHDDDQPAADDADVSEEWSGDSQNGTAEEGEWQEEEFSKEDSDAGDTQDDYADTGSSESQETQGSLSDEPQSSPESETYADDMEDMPVSDDMTGAEDPASEAETELTPEQIRAFQEKVRVWKNGDHISIVYNSTEEILLNYSIYPGVTELTESSGQPLYSGILGRDEQSGFYYETVDLDAESEADTDQDPSENGTWDIPVCVVIDDGVNLYQESIGSVPGAVEIESAELNNGNIDIAWKGGSDASGYAVIVKGSGIDVYETAGTEISVSASESEEYVIGVSAYIFDEDTGIMQFGEAGFREVTMSGDARKDSQKETDGEEPEDADTASADESVKTPDETAEKSAEEQEKSLTAQGNQETVSTEAVMDIVKSGTCGENLTWTLDSQGVLTISGTGKMEDYTSNGGPWYSSSDSIKSVVIKKGVTTIGEYAFIYCSSLENITIPEGVTSIGRSAFESCTRLKEITIPEGVTSIGTCAFYYCIEMKEIALPQSLLSIGDQAFYNVPGPSSIDLPEGLTTIGYYAFAYMSGLEEVSVPDSVVTLGSNVFSSCRRLKSVALGKGITVLPVNAFYRDSALEKVILPQKLEHIGAKAFYSCTGMSQVSIPDSVKVIDSYAFAFGTSLTEITLPASLDVLGEYAFYGCTNLRTVILPDRVFEAGENVFEGCADALQFQDRKGQILTDVTVGEESPAVSSNRNNQNYSVQYAPRYSYLINEGGRRLRVEYTDGVLTREYFSEEGNLLSRKSIPFELSEFGGFFAGEDSYFVVFGQNNDEEDDEKEVIRIVKYSREWVRQGAASICGENTTVPFRAGTVSLTETGGMLYMRTSHQMYTSLSDGLRHQANLTAVIRESDMTVSWIFSDVWNVSSGYVSHSFNQIVKTDGADILASDHGDAYPRGIVLFRYAGKAGAEKLGYPQYVIVLPIAGKTGANATGASLGALEASSSHYLVAGNSVSQDEDSYNTSGVRNIFVTATPKNDFTSSATQIHWLTSYTGKEKVSTPVMTALPDGRFLLMWTVDEVLNYCFLAADGSRDGAIYTGEGSLSDCEPYVKDNAVWWYVTKASAPVYYSISLKAPYKLSIQNPGHTVVFDPAGGTLVNNKMEVVHGSKYGELPVPEREAGYEFLGWYTGKNTGTKVTATSDVRVRPSETLYARWRHHWSFEEKTGTLRVLVNGGMWDYSDEWSGLKNRVKRVEFESGVTSIHDYAFDGFTSLESVVISNTVTSIGRYAFEDCTALKNITIPDGVTEIEDGAFEDCTALESIAIPNTVTTIGRLTFYNCKGLDNIIIPENVTEIGDYAFYTCSNLERVTIPSSVKSIGDRAFAYCSDNLKIYGVPGSYAEQYANDNNIPFRDMNKHYLEDATVTGITAKTYTGKAITQTPEVKIGDMTLVSGTDYQISYTDNTNVGTAAMTVKGIGNCVGTITESFKINPASVSRATVTGLSDTTYNGSAQTQNLTVKVSKRTLTSGTDYTLSYSDNTNAGTATVTITGKGNYTGNTSKTFTISALSISDATVTVTGIVDKKYTGKAITQTPVVKIGNSILASGTDYQLSYTDNTNVGTATVTITGINNLTGTRIETFEISKADQTITVKTTASTINVGQTATVSIAGARGTKSFKSSNTAIATVNAGTGVVTGKKAGTVTITATSGATSNYKAASGTVRIIVVLKKPGDCRFVKWNNSKYNSCQIAWNKVDGADGYQSLLSWTDGSHAASKILKSNVLAQNCSVAVNHVSQFKVRAFFNTSGGRVYSPWSNVSYITPSPTTLKSANAGTNSAPKVNISWNIIYGCNGYNVFLTTNPNGTWYWNQSTSIKASATSAAITKYRGAKLKKGTRYYVRIVTRRQRNGVFCTVPLPAKNTNIGSFVVK